MPEKRDVGQPNPSPRGRGQTEFGRPLSDLGRGVAPHRPRRRPDRSPAERNPSSVMTPPAPLVPIDTSTPSPCRPAHHPRESPLQTPGRRWWQRLRDRRSSWSGGVCARRAEQQDGVLLVFGFQFGAYLVPRTGEFLHGLLADTPERGQVFLGGCRVERLSGHETQRRPPEVPASEVSRGRG